MQSPNPLSCEITEVFFSSWFQYLDVATPKLGAGSNICAFSTQVLNNQSVALGYS